MFSHRRKDPFQLNEFISDERTYFRLTNLLQISSRTHMHARTCIMRRRARISPDAKKIKSIALYKTSLILA